MEELKREQIKLGILEDEFQHLMNEDTIFFEAELSGKSLENRQEWLERKYKMDRAKKELETQRIKVAELKGDVMTDSEIDKVLGDGEVFTDSDDIIEALASSDLW